MAYISHVCEGKVYFTIEVEKTMYQLELDSMDADWKGQHIGVEYKAITLMRWVRKGMANGNLIQLTP